ncbi:GGDEF domain-containing protein [Paenibacillus pinistramenti]|uniref:sensor domain-containing diguanylate cyclase n=1 Tax=Paenibacillus pinistramenti TaxID=1768003 RepID=UPI0011088528|nr:GGDEF domain-containing protein [Paenibacillus pinistramenti]
MNELFLDFITILLPTYFFFYMAITLIHRNRKSMINRIAALLMTAFLFYFLFEYLKTSLLPQYQMQLVLYGSAPTLLLVICTLVHLSILMGGTITLPLTRGLPAVYAAPYLLWAVFLVMKDHRELYNVNVTDGRSPLDPLFLLLTLIFVAGYILFSAVLLAVCWYRSEETKRKRIYRSLLLNLFMLFVWFIIITALQQTGLFTTRVAMIFYFINYFLWAAILRHLIGKHNIMPEYRKLFHILFESAPNAILLLDTKGTIKEMNPRALQWFEGIPAEDIPGLFEFKEGITVEELLHLFLQGQTQVSQMEVQMHNPPREHLDLIMGIDRIEGANEELFVMHLTDVTSLKDTERKLLESEQSYKHIAHHDPLTDLYNRAAIQELLLQKAADQEPFALVMVDLNHFKPINDTYGHLVGDLYLKHIANLLTYKIQLPGDFIGRIGGDEFLLILPYTSGNTMDQEVTGRLSALEKNPFVYKGREIPISFSAGLSVYPRDATDIHTLMILADEAMYKVKRRGRRGETSSQGGKL